MKKIEFNVTLTVHDLYAFTIRHTYGSASGVLGIVISIASWVFLAAMFSSLAVFSRVVLFFVGLLFTVIQPLMLYFKCSRQIKKNKGINAPLQYILSEEGICIRQKEETAEVKWYDIRKVVTTRKGLYLYLSPIRAFIFPAEQCGGDYAAIRQMVSAMVEKYKEYVPDDEEGAESISEEGKKNED